MTPFSGPERHKESVDAQAEAERKQSLAALAHGAEAITAEVSEG